MCWHVATKWTWSGSEPQLHNILIAAIAAVMRQNIYIYRSHETEKYFLPGWNSFGPTADYLMLYWAGKLVTQLGKQSHCTIIPEWPQHIA